MKVDAASLKEKLRRVEALLAGAATEGEREAARNARQRLLARLEELQGYELPVEYRFSIADPWSRKLFLALARRYGLRAYRRPRQHRSTILLMAPERFVEEVFWPEFQELDAVLGRILEQATDELIAAAFGRGAVER